VVGASTLMSWVRKGNSKISSGRYILKGNRIQFTTSWEDVFVDYNGIVSEDIIILDSHSRKTGHKDKKNYKFHRIRITENRIVF